MHDYQAKIQDDLNPEQKEAVEHIDGPLLVLAGAGTGKTKVLTSRIANIISSGKAFPSQILAVTFTNKASKEMLLRVENIIGRVDGMQIGTFHSISARILRRHAAELGLQTNFTILDSDDQIRLLKKLNAANNIDDKSAPPKAIAHIINGWKDKAITSDKVKAGDESSELGRIAAQIYPQYQQRLVQLNAADFGDLILYVITLLKNHPHILDEYHRRFRYILVDEYQDTNAAQYLWLRLFAQSNHNICCVGDDDQSIYGWRGAEIGNILRFEKDFPNSKVIKLERNYRSSNHILALASKLINVNKTRHPKTLWTDVTDSEKVKIFPCWDENNEAKTICAEVENWHSKKHQLKDMAILVRAFFQTRSLEEALISHAIPYKIIGGLRFYERKEIKDIIAYIRLASFHNDDLSFERIVNLPKRGVGNASFKQIADYARDNQTSLFLATKHLIAAGFIKGKVQNELNKFIKNIEAWHGLLQNTEQKLVVEKIINDSDYKEMLLNDKSLEAQTRLDNLKEFINAVGEFGDMAEFLEHISLVSSSDGEEIDKDMLNIMTLHAAKGLEFDTVFLSGWEEGVFPHQRSIDESKKAVEEERRLAYVGITRAKKRLFISFAANRRVFNQWQSSLPSRFIDELPSENIEVVNSSGLNFQRTAPSSAKHYQKSTPPKFQARSNKLTFKNGEAVTHEKFGAGKIKMTIGDVAEVIFDCNKTRFVTVKQLEAV
jgi:DNA helicase-2/ATP-dependent DNA helicase PcrA